MDLVKPLVIFTICCLIYFFFPFTQPETVSRFSGTAMEMEYHITIGKPLSPHQSRQVKEIIQSVFNYLDNTFNQWNPHSEIGKINQLGADIPSKLSKDLNYLLLVSQRIVQLSEGRFDPTVEPLRRLWRNKLDQGLEPSEKELHALNPLIGWDKIHLENGVLTKLHKDVSLNLDSLSKGYCVDLLASALQAKGYQDLFVEWGGEIKATGQHPEGRDWQVFVSNLGSQDSERALAVIPLKDSAVATSGDYLQNWSTDKTTYHHILDPRTLKARVIKPGGIASVTVQAPTCHLADALATAGMLFDRIEEAEAWAKRVQQEEPNVAFWFVTRME